MARGAPAYLSSLLRYAHSEANRSRVEDRVAELKEADRQKNEFVALLAHEIGQSTGADRDAVEILRSFNNAEPKFQTSLNDRPRHRDEWHHMLEDLLDVSRLTRNRLALRKQPLELTQIIGEAIETSQPYLE